MMFYPSELGTMLIFRQIRFFGRNSTWRHAKLPKCLGHFVLNMTQLNTLELWGIKTNTCTYCNESYFHQVHPLTHPRKYMEEIPHVHFIYIATLLYSNVAGKSKIRGELFIKTSIQGGFPMICPWISIETGGPSGRLAAHFQRHQLGQTATQGVSREVKPG